MAKTLRTSGDYTIKTGTGAAGSNTVFFDSKTTRVVGDLVVDGTRTELNTATMSIEDQFIEVNRGNSTADSEDSGIFFNRGTANHGLLYWDAGNDNFELGTSTNAPTVSTIDNITHANIKVNVIAPGPTIKSKRQTDRHFRNQVRSTLLKKSVRSEDICDTVEFLINNNSVTGQIIAVDSGQNLSWNKKNEKE